MTEKYTYGMTSNKKGSEGISNKTTNESVNLVLTELIKEHRRSRHLGYIFKFLWLFVIVAIVLFSLVFLASIGGVLKGVEYKAEPHIALVKMSGTLDDWYHEHHDLIAALSKAFENKQVKGIILKINSPGGSPVVADELYTEIVALKNKHKKPLEVVAGDICASGGYYLAMAGDKLHVNHSSIIGSIGVIHMSFGLNELLNKIGANPRIITSGERKAILNPFTPLNEEDEAHIKTTLDNIHQRFIGIVKESRKDKLKNDEVFNGLFWSGERAIELGLADEINGVSKVAKAMGVEEIVEYSTRKITVESLLAVSFQNIMNNFVRGEFFELSTPK